MREVARGQRTVPVLVEDGKVVQVGWQGRGCIVDDGVMHGQRLFHSSPRSGAGRGLPSVRLSPGARQHARRMGAERRRGSRDSSRRRRAGAAGVCARAEDRSRRPPPASRRSSSASRRRSACTNSRFARASTASGRRSAFRPTCRCATIASKNCSIRDDPRYRYPYINCTNCGPRYTVVLGLPYDRPQHHDEGLAARRVLRRGISRSGNRRFHAQPVACPAAGPATILQPPDETLPWNAKSAIQHAAQTC